MVRRKTSELYATVVSPEMKMLGRKIDRLRQKAGLSKSALAIEAELSQFYIHRIINGTCKISVPTLQKIAGALQARVKDLIDF
jgi:transcriptional regulator with XRE-family HTH domain